MKRSFSSHGAMGRLMLGTTLLALLTALFGVAPVAAVGADILILDTTVSGSPSLEEQQAVALGFTVDVVDPVTWSAMTTADFATYKAIVLGDPTCQTAPAPALTAAEANRTVWSPAVTGNVIVNGTDPVFHQSISGAVTLINRSINFAAAEPGKTGLYLSLSCYYFAAPPDTPVVVLDQFGPFKVVGQGGCPADSHIVASHPALAGLTDADLSNWGCSTHEGFMHLSIPVTFEVLAISEDIPSAYVAPDGTTGAPYIVARGVTVISDIDLAPETDTNPVGTQHCLTATVTEGGTPTPGTTVTFEVVGGPHTGVTGTGVTDSNGQATFCYPGVLFGTDTIQATFIDSTGVTQRSNRVEKIWTGVVIGPPATLELTPETDTNTVGDTHCVTATVTDAAGAPVPGVVVNFTVSGANSAAGAGVTDANGQAQFCYVGTAAGTDDITATAVGGSNPSDTATKRWLAGAPATLELTPETDTNTVDDQHCVTATVRDAFGNPTPGITVEFSVTPTTFRTPSSGSATTDANGQATFCYTSALPGDDVISAFADTNSNGVQDPGEPSDTAEKTWVLPASTEGCKVNNGGRITAANGDMATFGGNAKGTGPSGQEEYQDHGPAQPMNVHSINVMAVTCSADGTSASIFGTATIDGAGSFDYRIDVKDPAAAGLPDTYRIRLSNGYDSGEKDLSGGNVEIH
jgi:hypothetical protein